MQNATALSIGGRSWHQDLLKAVLLPGCEPDLGYAGSARSTHLSSATATEIIGHHGFTRCLLANTSGQGQQRLGAAHGPYRAAARAGEIFQRVLVSGW